MNINKTAKILFPLSFFLLLANICFGQKDTVLVKQGDKLVGEMQSLDHDMLLFKTQYADGAIAIKWSEVLGLHAAGKYKVLQSNGRIDVGSLQLDTANKSAVLKILTPDSVVHIKRTEIQEISRFDKKLTDRLKIDADLGVIKTKANNADQATFEIALRYFAQRWEFDFDYSAYASTVDTIHTNRASVGFTAKYNFPENWFLITRINSFTSTEQMIDYRVTYFAGSGKYIIRHHRISLWGYVGGTYNREKYTINPKAFKTAESFVGFHFESSPIDRVGIVSELIAYPSLSEWGRVRAYSKTDVSITFARHFRFGLGYVLNSDNKPPVNSSKSDYLFNAKLGWSL